MKHEQLTRAIIEDDELGKILDGMKLLRPDVVKLALGQKDAPDLAFSTWESILTEIIVGDAFGADRMDYLLRDSHHAGVAYGRFDHFRLIDTLRILPAPPADKAEHERMIEEIIAGLTVYDNEHGAKEEGESKEGPAKTAGASTKAPMGEPALGILDGGLHSAEALMLARYFMFTQLYFHPVRRIYDIHLKDFLKQWLPGGQYPAGVAEHLNLSDNEVTAAILAASRDATAPGHDPARRIAQRGHFKLIYQRHPNDLKITLEPGKAVVLAAAKKFGPENVQGDCEPGKAREPNFPVQPKEGPIASAMVLSEPLRQLPVASCDYVFVSPEVYPKARAWMASSREEILKTNKEEQHG